MSDTPPRILLTGASGFVGRRLASALAMRYPNALRVALVHQSKDVVPDLWVAKTADLTDAGVIASLVAEVAPTHLVHLAAQSSVGNAPGAADLTWRANFFGTYHLAGAMARLETASIFFFASSAEVYGTSFQNNKVTELTAPMPSNTYASSKLAAERMLCDLLPQNCRLITVRPVNHSGAGQDERFVLPSFAAQIARIEATGSRGRLMVGNLDAIRDFLHVDDVIDVYMRLIDLAPALPPRLLVNVASGTLWKIGTLLQMLVDMARQPLEIVPDPARMRASDIPSAEVDAGLLGRLTGWAPQRTMLEMLQQVLDEARKHHALPSAALMGYQT